METEPRVVRHRFLVSPPNYEIAVFELLEQEVEGFAEETNPDGSTVVDVYLPYGDPAPTLSVARAVSTDVEPGWREGWRAFHHPVSVGPFFICATWHEIPPGVDPIIIEPGLAFGTGSHGSTRAALEILLDQTPAGSFADIGCGSGVLAIAAARLGFSPVFAIDLDGLAIVATRENAERNGVRIEIEQRDALVDDLPGVPVAVANLERRLLEPLLRREGLPASLIVSGLLAGEDLDRSGATPLRTVERDGWRAELLAR